MHILLDFDGVILKNEKIERIINERSIQYVAKKTNTSYAQAKIHNSEMYKKLGHTALSLNNSTTYHQEVCEYNSEVFHKLDFDSDIRPHITREDISHVQNVMQCFEGSNKPGLFTNTPLIWVYETLGIIGFDIEDVFNADSMFTSDDGFVKPKLDTYQNVNTRLKYRELVFIDDNEKNIVPSERFDNWIGIHVPKNNTNMLYNYSSLLANV